MSLEQPGTVIIDRTTSMIIEGTYQFDRNDGGVLVVPAGSSFPVTPVAGEFFWRTDTSILYRRNDGDTAWEPAVAGDTKVKSGEITSGWSGTPKKATVTFGSAFASASYSVSYSAEISSGRGFAPQTESKTASGFVVNLLSDNVANLAALGWQAILHGE